VPGTIGHKIASKGYCVTSRFTIDSTVRLISNILYIVILSEYQFRGPYISYSKYYIRVILIPQGNIIYISNLYSLAN
jgi:hypothetical protein